ncbi:type II and III secretion system protein family protein [Geomesophilobacter sediminis]|uniref:Pilus assembly protein N-terminal domain-containing protein n=1 Tax=Geomesophilobacter sediminis TaxID=2798584 RepID=A0A8J7LZ10_9BACT|nr:pilus assembly protein N-terminal domain-containing protein [Geomesophilobacter sediminis]MBJ6725731.1 pilus assembly protein N-terminal domain-containing protein [Geomesophilobacter sediminis]
MKQCLTKGGIWGGLVLWLLCCGPVSALAGVPTEVVVHKSVLLNLQRPTERVSVAAPDIAQLVVISPTQLQVNGKKIGTTTLIVWEKGGKTTFFDLRVKGDVMLLQDQINGVLCPNDAVTVDYANDTIVISGQVRHDYTAKKALKLAQAYAAKNEGGGGEEPEPEKPLDNSQASYQAVAPNTEREDLSPKLPGNGKDSPMVINLIQVMDPQQVLLEVKVAQVDKSALASLGISALVKGAGGEGFINLAGAAPFPNGSLNPLNGNQGIAGNAPGIGALNGVKDAGLDAFQAGVSVFKPGIGAILKALSTKSLAKVLAEPNLLVRSGQVGKFLAGSKIPFSYVSGVGALSATSIQFIDVGVKLNFRPELLDNGLISLKIDPAEVSGISGTLAVNGYPIIDTREVRTRVQLKDGESLVLAGLLQEQQVKTMSKIPILGDIPVLGALFRSTQNDLQEKELVFFITPRLVSPSVPGTKVPLPTDRPLTPEQERELQWMPLGK